MENQHKVAGYRENGSGVIVADGSVALAIRYIGSQVSATITVVTATSITFKHGAAAAEVVDTKVGASDGVLLFSSYTTLGALVDNLNNSGNWQAEIVDGLRATASDNYLLARSETTIIPKTEVLPLYFDSSAKFTLDYAISSRRLNFNKSQKGKVAVFQQARALVNVGSGTLILSIYDVDSKRATATLLATFNGTDNTELSALIAGGVGELRSEVGHDLLLSYVCSVDCPDSGAYLNVAGHIEK